jgi:hypothetical protein
MMILAKLLQWTAAGLLGVAVTWWVVEHAGDNTGMAVVHMTEPGVDVVVGDQTFRAEECPRSPLVCELPAGRHELRVSRGDRLLRRKVFTLGRGEQVVLTAWVPHRARPLPRAQSLPPGTPKAHLPKKPRAAG